MELEKKEEVNITHEDFVKSTFSARQLKFNALKLIYELDIQNELDESSYIKHIIPKQDGSKRILFEPKPLLKEIQRQLLFLLNSLKDHKEYSKKASKIKRKYLPTKSSTAYSKGSSVVKNANFHIGQDVLLKLDISKFFTSITRNKTREIWSDILSLKSKYLEHLGIFKEDFSEEKKQEVLNKLVQKIVAVTTLNNCLTQGSPTSGHIANAYLARFDKNMLDYCVKNGLCYSRYSDDMTFSGSKSVLMPSKIIKFVQHELHKRSLRLNNLKTKVLKKNKRQTVTGIVVNEKRSAGKTYKRALRMEMYFLKKFREDHISKKSKEPFQYIEVLAGKINWILNVNKIDPEFKRYKGELSIIKRFIRSGKTIAEAVEYISRLSQPNLQNTQETVLVSGVYWRVADERCTNNSITLVRKNSPIVLFSEKDLENTLKNNPGWRLPSEDEFKSYVRETNYEDRRMLGIRYSSDPHFNGFADENGYKYYNRVGVYWTSDLAHLNKETLAKERIARKIVCFYSFNNPTRKKLNHQYARQISRNVYSLSVNNKQKIDPAKTKPIEYYLDPTYHENSNSSAGECSIRLVKCAPNEQKEIIPSILWNSILASSFSVDLSELKLEDLNFPLQNYSGNSLLLSKNNIKELNEEHYPPIKRLDLRNNKLSSVDFNKLPRSLKHIRLEGNQKLKLSNIPWKRFYQSLHELTADEIIYPHTSIDQIYLSALGCESWISVSTDAELDDLILRNTKVNFLRVNVILGSDNIETKELFKRISQITANHVFISVITADEKLNKLLDNLKMISGSSQPLLELNEYLNSIDYKNDKKYNWRNKEQLFVSADYNNQHLKSLILDLSWIPTIRFSGDFEIKPDLYHILHAGTPFIKFPATSAEFHRPNMLVKVYGKRLIDSDESNLIVFYPLDNNAKKSKHKKIQTLLPANQVFVDELILVVSGENKLEQQAGKIEEHFPKSQAIKRLNSTNHRPKPTIKLALSKRVSGFPLLGFSIQFDVHKLSIPLESFYKKNRKTMKGQRKIIPNLGNTVDWSEVELSELMYTEKKTRLNMDNQLSELEIFSHKVVAETPLIPQETNNRNNQPYIIKKGVFAKHVLYSPGVNSRTELLKKLETGEIEAKHLPSKLKNDEEVMLTAVKRNPFSMIFSSRRLKENPDFLLKACEISFRTLVFLPVKLIKQSKTPESAINRLLDYLMSRLKPDEFYFIINKLGTHIAAEGGDYPYFKCEPNALNNSCVIPSFESEVFHLESTRRTGMPNVFRKFFLNEASKRNFFNNNGYYNSLEHALQNADDCRHLDLSFKGPHYDLDDLSRFNNLKTLNLSYTNVSCQLPFLPSLEELYADCAKGFSSDNDLSALKDSVPNLRIICIRETLFSSTLQLTKTLGYFPQIEKLDIRPYFYTKEKEFEAIMDRIKKDGREIDVPIKTDKFF